ncbi:MAE_28990/MAE_18760 family HEPN-like nuclease [Rhizobium sp. KDH_Rht_773_N]|jgi:hypothetical protein
MSKAFTEDEFSDQITQDRTWRLREISDLKSAVRRADRTLQTVLLRALVTVCYAHWEGYVKFTAMKYMDFIARRKLQYSELNSQFLRNYFLPRLAALSINRTSVKDRCALVDEILFSADKRFSKTNVDLINTKANLNYDVLTDICTVCGLSIDDFSASETFLDVLLLKRRNEIAHGENTFVAVEDLDDIADRTIALMRTFGDAVENQIATKGYRADAQPAAAGAALAELPG